MLNRAEGLRLCAVIRAYLACDEVKVAADTEFDVVLAGGGVNALACGCVLARHGLTVAVIERNPWIGGGAITREVTLPGFKHDLYGSSHVWIHANPELQPVLDELKAHGLKLPVVGRPHHRTPGQGRRPRHRHLPQHRQDGREHRRLLARRMPRRYRRVYDDFSAIREGFIKAFFSPPAPPSLMTRALERSREGLRRLREFSLSARAWVEQNFENDFIRAVMLNWALAPQILPEQEGAGQSFYIMIPAVHVYGQAIPAGRQPGAAAGHGALHRGARRQDLHLRTGAASFLIESNVAKGVVLEDGRTIRARRAVVSALDPKQSFLKLTPPDVLQPEFLELVRGYSFGKISICRIHLALSEPPRFNNGAEMSRCAFHRIVDSSAQMIRQYAQIAEGIAPSDPFLWSACWTLMDPSRAPPGKHTLICDTFVPNWLQSGETWAQIQEQLRHRRAAHEAAAVRTQHQRAHHPRPVGRCAREPGGGQPLLRRRHHQRRRAYPGAAGVLPALPGLRPLPLAGHAIST